MIEVGDFIQSEGCAYYGWVRGDDVVGKNIPAWRIDAGGGKVGVILKRYAKLLWKGEENDGSV